MANLLVAAGAGLAVLVEMLEALMILLAVGASRSWRDAGLGAAAAILTCAALAVVAGPLILEHLGLTTLRLVIGTVALWYGFNWLRKNVLRLAGRKSRSSSAAEYDEAVAAARATTDWAAFALVFKGVLLEGIEVVVIVSVFAGRPSGAAPAIIGAVVAGVIVVLIGLVLHKPISRAPETELKFTVGALLTTFGTFFLGEGLGLDWPGGDLALLYLLALVVAGALGAVRALR